MTFVFPSPKKEGRCKSVFFSTLAVGDAMPVGYSDLLPSDVHCSRRSRIEFLSRCVLFSIFHGIIRFPLAVSSFSMRSSGLTGLLVECRKFAPHKRSFFPNNAMSLQEKNCMQNFKSKHHDSSNELRTSTDRNAEYQFCSNEK